MARRRDTDSQLARGAGFVRKNGQADITGWKNAGRPITRAGKKAGPAGSGAAFKKRAEQGLSDDPRIRAKQFTNMRAENKRWSDKHSRPRSEHEGRRTVDTAWDGARGKRSQTYTLEYNQMVQNGTVIEERAPFLARALGMTIEQFIELYS